MAAYKTLVVDEPLHAALKEKSKQDGLLINEAVAVLVRAYTRGEINISVQISAAPAPGSVIAFHKEALAS